MPYLDPRKSFNHRVFLLLMLVGVSCDRPPVPQPPSIKDSTANNFAVTPPQDPNQLWLDSLRNCLYVDDNEGRIRLIDGTYLVPRIDSLDQWPVAIGVGGFELIDLDKDGFRDAIGFANSNYGGSGIFISMNAFLNRNGSALHVSSVSLGDRTGIDTFFVVQDTINLRYITQGPDDPMCCPTMVVHKRFVFRDSSLVEINE